MMANSMKEGAVDAIGATRRGKYTFLMRPRFCSRLRVAAMSERSKRRQHDEPVRKKRTYGTPSDLIPNIRPKMTEVTKIGRSGLANSQNMPSVVDSYRSLILRPAKNQRILR